MDHLRHPLSPDKSTSHPCRQSHRALQTSPPKMLRNMNMHSNATAASSGNNNSSDKLFSSSPMISGLRTLHLPNLELRDAARMALGRSVGEADRVLSNHEYGQCNDAMIANGGRIRSKSVGDAREQRQTIINHHGTNGQLNNREEALMRERVASNLSLCFSDDETLLLNGNANNFDSQYNNYKAIQRQEYHEIEKIEQREENNNDSDNTTMRQSQSCTISKLGEIDQQYSSSNNTSHRSPQKSNVQNTDPTKETTPQSPSLSILYGLINTSIVLPVLMSFGSIIYHDDFFKPYLSTLLKLTVLSGAVHQITFASFSSLPFAVGQVQDAGLIFLSTVSSDLVRRLRLMKDDVEDEVILATVCVGLSLCTAILGGALMLVGRFRLASYMQLLPGSVVGGYLAYIGFFCGQAGLALMARENVTGLNDWYKFMNEDAIIHILPGIIGGLFIYISVRNIQHMAVLPSSIVLIMLLFYSALWITGTTVKEATENGWINESTESQNWKHTWDYLRVDKVVWSVLPSQIGTLLAMISVVALSSSLDVAAIEIELKRPLDYNHELTTVGLSNVVSGLTGGYTGSYIFSQTIFSLRMGIRSRLMGYVIASLSIVAVVIPFNILSYIPNLFFGSLLILISLDLMFEWLIDVRLKLKVAEYFVVLMTFSLLQVLGVEFGILTGVVLYFTLKKIGCDVGS